MNILHITPTYKPAYIYGGVTVSISLLCESLAAAGHDVTVVTTNANGKDELELYAKEPTLVEGVKVHYFGRWIGDPLQFSPSMCWWLWQNVGKYDAVHLHTWWNLGAMCPSMVCYMKGVKAFFSPRGMLSEYTMKGGLKRTFHRAIGLRLLRNTILHATAERERKECLAIIPNWGCMVLPNLLQMEKNGELKMENAESGMGGNEEWRMMNDKYKMMNVEGGTRHEESAISSGKRGKFRLIFLSRIHPKKGLEMLFEALEDIGFDWVLTIAGDGDVAYMEGLKKKAVESRIDGRIEWVGWVGSGDKYTYLGGADLMVLTSYNENFANVVVESLAVGTPVLLSGEVGLSDYVLEKELGWICDTTVESIRDALREAYGNVGKRQLIRQIGSEKIRADFDPGMLAWRYADMYALQC